VGGGGQLGKVSGWGGGERGRWQVDTKSPVGALGGGGTAAIASCAWFNWAKGKGLFPMDLVHLEPGKRGQARGKDQKDIQALHLLTTLRGDRGGVAEKISSVGVKGEKFLT